MKILNYIANIFAILKLYVNGPKSRFSILSETLVKPQLCSTPHLVANGSANKDGYSITHARQCDVYERVGTDGRTWEVK